MAPQESIKATPDEKIAQKAKVWRRREKEAIACSCNATRRAEYNALQALREAVDLLEKKAGAG